MSRPRVLVTGAGGLLGRPLVRLLRGDHDVVATDLPELDVADGAAVTRTVGELRPDHVVHLAAWTDVDGCERDPERADRVHRTGTANVASAAAAVGADLLYVSTDYVYDGGKTGPYTEDDPVAPLSTYGRSKLDGETAVEAAGGTWRIVRCQSLYGRGRKSFVDAVLARARAGEPLQVVTDQRVSPSYADDMAAALVAVLRRAPAGLYLAANAGSCTWHAFARAVLDEAGLTDVPVGEITAAALGRPAPRPANSTFDCARLVAATGHAPRPWREAMAEYLSTVPQTREDPR